MEHKTPLVVLLHVDVFAVERIEVQVVAMANLTVVDQVSEIWQIIAATMQDPILYRPDCSTRPAIQATSTPRIDSTQIWVAVAQPIMSIPSSDQLDIKRLNYFFIGHVISLPSLKKTWEIG
jgi:hypothetical protein